MEPRRQAGEVRVLSAAGLHMGDVGFTGGQGYVHARVDAPFSLADSLKGCLDPAGLNFGAVLRSLLKHCFAIVQSAYPRRGLKGRCGSCRRGVYCELTIRAPVIKSCPFSFSSPDHCVHYYDLRNTKQPIMVFKGHRKAVSYAKFVSGEEIVSA